MSGKGLTPPLRIAICNSRNNGWHWLTPAMQDRKRKDTCIIYIHGYANKPSDAISAYYTLMHHTKDMGVDHIGFVWPSKGKITRYFSDLRTTREVVDELMSLIAILKAEGYKKIGINAHSMGGHLTMEFMRYLKELKLRNNPIDMIALLGADCIRWKFKEKNKYGIVSNLVKKLYNYYSPYDNILRFVSKLARPLQRIGNHDMPRRSPSNYVDIDANHYSSKKVRHRDYKKLHRLQRNIVSKLLQIDG